MKKYVILTLALVFVFNLTTTAQEQVPGKGEKGPRKEFRGGGKPEITPEMRANKMAKQLSLTDAEKAKVKALFEAQEANRVKMETEVKKTHKEMKAQFEADRKAQDAELEKIIGAEKFQKLQADRVKRLEKMKKRLEKAPEAPAVK